MSKGVLSLSMSRLYCIMVTKELPYSFGKETTDYRQKNEKLADMKVKTHFRCLRSSLLPAILIPQVSYIFIEIQILPAILSHFSHKTHSNSFFFNDVLKFSDNNNVVSFASSDRCFIKSNQIKSIKSRYARVINFPNN